MWKKVLAVWNKFLFLHQLNSFLLTVKIHKSWQLRKKLQKKLQRKPLQRKRKLQRRRNNFSFLESKKYQSPEVYFGTFLLYPSAPLRAITHLTKPTPSLHFSESHFWRRYYFYIKNFLTGCLSDSTFCQNNFSDKLQPFYFNTLLCTAYYDWENYSHYWSPDRYPYLYGTGLPIVTCKLIVNIVSFAGCNGYYEEIALQGVKWAFRSLALLFQ